jgi:hypothetical protein
MFVTDPMGQNEDFVSGRDIEIVTSHRNEIAERLRFYYRNPAKLADLARSGQRIMFDIRDQESHLRNKVEMIRDIIDSVLARSRTR